MYLGVVANPIPSRDFNGKIFLDRVSRTERYKNATCNQNFTDIASVNADIKAGKWYEHVNGESMKLSDLKDKVALAYNLDDDIKDRLVIRFYIPCSNAKNGMERRQSTSRRMRPLFLLKMTSS